MFRLDVVFAVVPIQPAHRHAPVESDTVDGHAVQPVLFDLRQELGHQPQRVGAVGQLLEVVHAA